jgi:hypothetical protein
VTISGLVATLNVVPAFQIRWQSSDLSCLQTPPITTSTVGPVSTTSAGPAGTGSAGPGTGPIPLDSAKLSPGAAAGVAIGVILAVALVISGIFYFKRRESRNRKPSEWGTNALQDEAPGSHGGRGISSHKPAELLGARDAGGIAEAQAWVDTKSPSILANELPVAAKTTATHELPGGLQRG